MAEETGAQILAPVSGLSGKSSRPSTVGLQEGDRVHTDQGCLVALEVPGHSRDHLAFHWVEANAVFVGDLILGRGDTTWVGEYLGCVEDYLSSLDRIQALNAAALYPSHGPPVTDPTGALNRFRHHRLQRLEEVRAARELRPEASPADLAVLIYGGEIPPKLLKAASASVEAALFHLDRAGPSG